MESERHFRLVTSFTKPGSVRGLHFTKRWVSISSLSECRRIGAYRMTMQRREKMPAAPRATAPEVSSQEEVSPRMGVPRPKGTKTGAVKEAMRRYPTKTRGEITELLRGEGWDITPQQISVIKSQMLAGLRRPKRTSGKASSAAVAASASAAAPTSAPASTSASAPAPTSTSTPARASDLSFRTLQRAKELANQMGGVPEAQRALEALSQLIG